MLSIWPPFTAASRIQREISTTIMFITVNHRSHQPLLLLLVLTGRGGGGSRNCASAFLSSTKEESREMQQDVEATLFLGLEFFSVEIITALSRDLRRPGKSSWQQRPRERLPLLVFSIHVD